jgi:hypothetical protein
MTKSITNNQFIDEAGFYKGISAWLASLLAAILAFLGKWSFNKWKERGNNIKHINKRLIIVEERLSRIDKSLKYEDSKGNEINITDKVRFIAHDLSQKDKIILDHLESIEKKLDKNEQE